MIQNFGPFLSLSGLGFSHSCYVEINFVAVVAAAAVVVVVRTRMFEVDLVKETVVD